MKVRVEVVSLNADCEQQRRQILTIERRELTMETLGMNLTEGKALRVCRILSPPNRQAKSWSNDVRVPAVIVGAT